MGGKSEVISHAIATPDQNIAVTVTAVTAAQTRAEDPLWSPDVRLSD
jgi:hypothetical protein